MEQLPRFSNSVRLTAPQFAQLAAGHSAVDGIATLQAAQLSRAMLLVKWLAGGDPTLARAAMSLAGAQRTCRSAANAVLAHPWLSVWAVQRLRGGATDRPDYLPYAALAATLATGGVARAPAGHLGVVPVPGAGVWRTGRRPRSRFDRSGPDWLPLRRAEATQQSLNLRLAVDDIDPYRDCYGRRTSPRLTEAAFASWSANLAEAWRLLTTFAPGYAVELAAGLRIFVPLADYGDGQHSVTHTDGFGAFAASLELTPADLAVTMVHEFQHSKLSGLLTLVRLFDDTDPMRYFAPWRAGPRPISGLLQGVYAFTAVGEVWASLREHPTLADGATRQVALVRLQVDRGIGELRRALSLTPAGHQWVDLLTERSTRLMALELPPDVHEEASRALAVSERAWLAGRR